MRFLKALSRPIDRLAISLVVVCTALFWASILPQRVDNLPGRPSAIMAPSVNLPATHDGAFAGSGPGHHQSWSLSTQTVFAAHAPKLSNATANLAADTVAALFNTGYLKIYDSTQAATADTAVSGQTLCATLRFNSTAFASASSGVATANAITSDTDAAATCTATWFRVLKSDNSTVVMDGSVGTSGADINLATVSIVQHATVSVTSFTYTQSKS